MNKKINGEVIHTTQAEIKVAMVNTEKDFYNAVRNKNFNEAIELAKRYIELSKLSLKRSEYLSKNNVNIYSEDVDDIQVEIGREVENIMNNGRRK